MGNSSGKDMLDDSGAGGGSDDDEEDEDYALGDGGGVLDPSLETKWEPTNYGVSSSDRRALTKFFEHGGGYKWRAKDSWTKPSPLGMWYGVAVSTRHGQKMVTAVNLHHNRVRGDLARSAVEFSKILYLEVLNLGNNKIKGKLPPELKMVERLKELRLNDNGLTGPVPAFLAEMPVLKRIDLAANELSGRLSGALASQFAKHHKIEVFDVNNNALSGFIAEEWGQAQSLRELGLGGNHFTGEIPAALCDLQHLERLDLHENRLFSEIPEGIGKLGALKRLRLHGNTRIDGALPPELVVIGRLQVLSLHFEDGQDRAHAAAQ